MSMFGGGWTEELIQELRDDGDHERADRILIESRDNYWAGFYADNTTAPKKAQPIPAFIIEALQDIEAAPRTPNAHKLEFMQGRARVALERIKEWEAGK